MLSHCANPQCSKPFLRLGQGKLFMVATEDLAKAGDLTDPLAAYARRPAGRMERFWLCDQCAQVWTLVQRGDQGVALLPLSRLPSSVPTKPDEVRRTA